MFNWLFIGLLVANAVPMTLFGIFREKMFDTVMTAGSIGIAIGVIEVIGSMHLYGPMSAWTSITTGAPIPWAGFVTFVIGGVFVLLVARQYAGVEVPRTGRTTSGPRTNYGIVAEARIADY